MFFLQFSASVPEVTKDADAVVDTSNTFNDNIKSAFSSYTATLSNKVKSELDHVTQYVADSEKALTDVQAHQAQYESVFAAHVERSVKVAQEKSAEFSEQVSENSLLCDFVQVPVVSLLPCK